MTLTAFEPTTQQLLIWDAISQASDQSLVLVGYGGAAGGGKSRAIAELAVDLCLEWPGNRIVVGRKDFKDLRTTTMEEFELHTDPRLVFRRHGSEHWVQIRDPEWPDGVVSTVHFKEMKDYLGLGSEQYGAVLLDEAGEIPKPSALMLLSRLRHPAATKWVFMAGSNPWPGWFEEWFVNKQLPQEVLEDIEASVTFIPAKIRDNPHLQPSPEAYERRLRALYPPDWVDRLVDGRFDAFEGQVYVDLSPQRHRWVGSLPPFVRIVGGLDFGGMNPHDHMSAGVVAGITGSGDRRVGANNLIRFAHFEDRGPKVYERQLSWMREVEVMLGRRVEWVADKSQSWGIELVQKQGFVVQPSHGGPGSVNAGIGLVARRFRDGTSYYSSLLEQPPGRDAAVRGAESWYTRMTRYRWKDEPGNPQQRIEPEPLKRDDDTADADRYMHEAADEWPQNRQAISRRTVDGRERARSAV